MNTHFPHFNPIRHRWLLYGAFLLCAWANLAHADTIDFTAPVNGWRNSTGSTERYTQEVHYPAASVNTPEDQATSAMIAGQIRVTPKAKSGTKTGASVGTLIVNGTPMPQRIEEDGQFSRPFAFDAGSNAVELRAAGGARRQVQFYDANSGKTHPRLRILLAWDTDGTDLDLHVISPDGQHTYYGDRVTPDGGSLDVDVTTGYGPEIYSNAAPMPGLYLVYVNYYGQGDSKSDMTVAQITTVINEGTPNEKRETVTVPMRNSGELTLVKRVVMP
jgi:uncharacterized protein YfaP (DUF2135 family)